MLSLNQKYLDKTVNLSFQAKQKTFVQRVGIPLTLGLTLASCAGGRDIPRTETTDLNQPVQMQRTVKETPAATLQPQTATVIANTEPVVGAVPPATPQAEVQQPIAELDSYAFGKTITNVNDCYTVANPNDCIKGFNDNVRTTAPPPVVTAEPQQPVVVAPQPVQQQPIQQPIQRQEQIVQQPSNFRNPLRSLDRWLSSSQSQQPIQQQQQQPVQRQASSLNVSGQCRSLRDTVNVEGFDIRCMDVSQMQLLLSEAGKSNEKIGSNNDAPAKLYMISSPDCHYCTEAIDEFNQSLPGNNNGQVVVIQNNRQISQTLGANRTPTFFVHFNNGTPSDLSDDYIGKATDSASTKDNFIRYINGR